MLFEDKLCVWYWWTVGLFFIRCILSYIVIRSFVFLSKYMWIRRGNHARKYTSTATTNVGIYLPFPDVLPLDFPPNDLPSNPGLAFPFLPTPFLLSDFLSFRIAILSVRFFCLAAIDFSSCSLRSSLMKIEIRNQTQTIMKMNVKTYQAFLLLPFSFSTLLTAFFNLPSSSFTFTPSIRASALAHFSLSSIDFRLSSGRAASFCFRVLSWSRAWVGFEEVFRCFLLEEDEEAPARVENVTFVWPGAGLEVDGWSGTSSCVYSMIQLVELRI